MKKFLDPQKQQILFVSSAQKSIQKKKENKKFKMSVQRPYRQRRQYLTPAALELKYYQIISQFFLSRLSLYVKANIQDSTKFKAGLVCLVGEFIYELSDDCGKFHHALQDKYLCLKPKKGWTHGCPSIDEPVICQSRTKEFYFRGFIGWTQGNFTHILKTLKIQQSSEFAEKAMKIFVSTQENSKDDFWRYHIWLINLIEFEE